MLRFLTLRRRPFARFARDEKGSVITEAVLVLPIMLWAVFALFTLWDSFRSVNVVQKASYTVSDAISREMNPVSMTYLTGLRDTMDYMLDNDQDVRMRITSVTWSEARNRFEVAWSRSPGNAIPQLTTSTLQAFAPRIPTMSDGDFAMLVETEVDHTPVFRVGLMADQTFREFIVTRPRFVPKICLTGTICIM